MLCRNLFKVSLHNAGRIGALLRNLNSLETTNRLLRLSQSSPECFGSAPRQLLKEVPFSSPSSTWFGSAGEIYVEVSPRRLSTVVDSRDDVVSFKLAQLGEGIKECELLSWSVKVGDPIEAFQTLCEVQSDKASVEITSKYTGTVEKLHHSAGDIVEVGAPLADIRLQAADIPAALSEDTRAKHSDRLGKNIQPQPERAEGGAVVAVPLAQTGEGIAECEFLSWKVGVGDPVEAFQPVCEVQSDKASVEITSRYSGRVAALRHRPGDMVAVGAALLDIELPPGEAPPGAGGGAMLGAELPPREAPSGEGPPPPLRRKAPVLASPAVRRIARESGLDLSAVRGTGPGGRVTKADALAALSPAGSGGERAEGAEQGLPAQEAPEAGEGGPRRGETPFAEADEPRREAPGAEARTVRKPLRGYARAMVKSMTEASRVPHFYFCDDLRMDRLVALRTRLKADPRHARLTYLPFLIKALSLAMSEYPALNSQLSGDGSEIVQFSSHNVGVAVATPSGLVVPNLKNVETKTVEEISGELVRLQELASEGRLEHEHLTGGTITVSNIGSIGGRYAMPLLNVPEAAIVALGRTRSVPFVDGNGGVATRAVMGVSWGADHRVVDGATVAAFSNAWKAFVEDPEAMIMKLR